MSSLQTTCCVVGGGPAGVMLGYLLARSGVQVTVLEKHKDFFRDFRGDTVHPSTLELFHELGLLEDFLKLPHQEVRSLGVVAGDFSFKVADFTHAPTHCKFIALMPQWDFLEFLSNRAKKFPSFQILMEHEAVGLLRDGAAVTGVEVKTPEGQVQIQCDLVVGCDGRHSTMRQAAHLPVEEFGVPIDVLWFRISRKPNDPSDVLGTLNYGRALILVNRGDYFQAGFIVRKGTFDSIKSQGLDAFRESLAHIAPYLADRVGELQDWHQVKLLTVKINRLPRWHKPGLLCIGDAAHAMSPAGGVGINLAIQDAVAAARILAEPLRRGNATEAVLDRVQQRRMFPTKVTQRLQVRAHKAFDIVFHDPGPLKAPWQLKAAVRMPGLRILAGNVVGIGVRPEHIVGTKRPVTQTRWARALALSAGVVAAVLLVRAARR